MRWSARGPFRSSRSLMRGRLDINKRLNDASNGEAPCERFPCLHQDASNYDARQVSFHAPPNGLPTSRMHGRCCSIRMVRHSASSQSFQQMRCPRLTERRVTVSPPGSTLPVSDASAPRDFYRDVVGWSVEGVEMKDDSEPYADYNMCGDSGSGRSVPGVGAGIEKEQRPNIWALGG